MLKKYYQEIKDTKKRLSIIYITHEQADHFLGSRFLRRRTGSQDYREFCGNGPINKVYREKVINGKTLGPSATPALSISTNRGNFIEFESSKIRAP